MTGKPILDKILIFALLAATLGTVMVFVYTELLYQKPLPSDQQELSNLKQEGLKVNLTQGFKIDKLIVVLKGHRRMRYLELMLDIIPFAPKDVELLGENKAFIYDTIIEIGGEMEAREINSVAGKILFEERIKKRIHNKFNKTIVKNIFFSKFVVQ